MADFEITSVDLYAQYGSQRVTSVPVGGSFEIHADYMIRNLAAGILPWTTCMTVYGFRTDLNKADTYGYHEGSDLKDAHDAVNLVMPSAENWSWLVQIFANQRFNAGAPPEDMQQAVYNNSDPTWQRLWYGAIGIGAGTGIHFFGSINSIAPASLKAGAPLQLTVGYTAGSPSVDVLDQFQAVVRVTIAGVTKEAKSPVYYAGTSHSGNLLLNFGTMPATPIDGLVVLRCQRTSLIFPYYEDVDSQTFQVLVTEEPPPPPPPPPPPGSATLYGQVKDSTTQGVLVSVKVIIGGKTAYTNTSGNYTIAGLTPGQVSVSFNKTGYQTLTQTYALIDGNNLLNAQMVKGTTPPPGDGGTTPSWLLPAAIVAGGALLLWPSKKQPEKSKKLH